MERKIADANRGELFFAEPKQVSGKPGTYYLRCAAEQRVIVEIEIAAQLAELNDLLRQIRDNLHEAILMR